MAAIDAIRDVVPHARFVQVDPVINVVTDPEAQANTKSKPRQLICERSLKRSK